MALTTMAKNRNSGLGRGLDAIFLDNAGEEPKSGVTMLRVSEIEPRPDQPRKILSPRRLRHLPIQLRRTEFFSRFLSVPERMAFIR